MCDGQPLNGGMTAAQGYVTRKSHTKILGIEANKLASIVPKAATNQIDFCPS
jgi:hypothetical protein